MLPHFPVTDWKSLMVEAEKYEHSFDIIDPRWKDLVVCAKDISHFFCIYASLVTIFMRYQMNHCVVHYLVYVILII